MKNLLLTVLLFFFLLISYAVISCNLEESAKMNQPQVIYDQEIGLLEKKLIEKYGNPDSINIFNAEEMDDELRARVKNSILKVRKDIIIKEFYYRAKNQERFFWLIQRNTNEWEVISDVQIPRGILF